MALWYETGNGFARTSMARCNLGIDVYLCCPGPSLKYIETSKLAKPGVMIAALTTAYPHIRPDIWFGMDEPECYDRTVWWQSFIKIARGSYQDRKCEEHLIKNCPQVYFADCKPPEDIGDIFKLRQHDVYFVWHSNTLALALHVLIWMGAKKIHFLGCDLGGGKDYYHDLVLSNDHREINKKLHLEQKEYLNFLTAEGSKQGIHLISCTPNSPINEFMTYLDLDDALKVSQSGVPNPGTPNYVLDVTPPKTKSLPIAPENLSAI